MNKLIENKADSNFSYVVSGGRDQRCFKTSLRNLLDCNLMFVEEKPIQRVLLDESGNSLNCWTATWSSTIRRWPLNLVKNNFNQNSKLLNGDASIQPNIVLKGNF